MKHKFNDVLDDMFYNQLELEYMGLQSIEDEHYNRDNDYHNEYDVQQDFYEFYELK